MPILPGHRQTRPNRRMHERVEVDSPAQLVGGAVVVAGRIENLSLTGAAFIAPESEPVLAAETHITLRVVGGSNDGTDAEFQGRVVRTEPFCDATGDSLAYAIVFDQPADV